MKRQKPYILYSTDTELLATPHRDDVCLHVLCHDGEFSFTYNGTRFLCRAGCLAIVPRPDRMKDVAAGPGLEVEFVSASQDFLNRQLPANHFDIGGSITLWHNPIIELTDAERLRISRDFRRVGERVADEDLTFYQEIMGSILLTMMNDLFEVHIKRDAGVKSTDRKGDLIERFRTMLVAGEPRTHRDVAYYADRLSVTPKYLSNVVYRQTGSSASRLIECYTIPLILESLKNSSLSLTQISDEFNFSSLPHFSRYIRKHLGMSPSEYRTTLQPSNALKK